MAGAGWPWAWALGSLAALATGCGALSPPARCPAGPGLGAQALSGAGMPASTVALSFDGGPGEATRRIGDYLYGNGVQAAFFVRGAQAVDRAGDLAALKARGHLVGNGGFSGRALGGAANPALEVLRTDAAIAPHVSGGMFLLRPPEGRLDEGVARRLNAAGLTRYVGPVAWDVEDACATQGSDAEACAARYVEAIRAAGRGIVRLSGDRAETATLLASLVPKLKDDGVAMVRLDEVAVIREALARSGGTPGTVGGGEGCSEY